MSWGNLTFAAQVEFDDTSFTQIKPFKGIRVRAFPAGVQVFAAPLKFRMPPGCQPASIWIYLSGMLWTVLDTPVFVIDPGHNPRHVIVDWNPMPVVEMPV